MATKKSTWRVGFMIPKELLVPEKHVITNRAAWSITLRPVIVGNHPRVYDEQTENPGKITNPSDSSGDYHGLFLNGFEIYAYAQREDNGTANIWHYEYRFDVFKVDRDNVHRLAKTIATIDRRMEKIGERDGIVRDFVDFVRRIGEAIKVETFVRPTTDHGWSYAENSHDFLTTGQGLTHLSYTISKWKASVENPQADHASA